MPADGCLQPGLRCPCDDLMADTLDELRTILPAGLTRSGAEFGDVARGARGLGLGEALGGMLNPVFGAAAPKIVDHPELEPGHVGDIPQLLSGLAAISASARLGPTMGRSSSSIRSRCSD